MLDPKNMVIIEGGVVADPEIINDKIAKFRIALDYAGSEKDSENNSGYFDLIYYLNGSDAKNADFVARQVKENKIKKGTSLKIIGRLVQERWKQDEQMRSKVVVVAEHLSYGSLPKNSSSNSASNSSTESSAPKAATSSASNIPSSF
jgi:single-stranded DNA-binding protein